MKVRLAIPDDSKEIFEWRNDRVTRLMSRNTNIVDWEQHATWYKSAILDPNRIIIIGEDKYSKIGMVRIDQVPNENTAEVSINLNPARRGQRLSYKLLKKALYLASAPENIKMVAQIKRQNSSSLSCFNKCGFCVTHSDKEYVYLIKQA